MEKKNHKKQIKLNMIYFLFLLHDPISKIFNESSKRSLCFSEFPLTSLKIFIKLTNSKLNYIWYIKIY